MLSGYHYFPFPLDAVADRAMKVSRDRWITAIGEAKCLASSLKIQTINPQIVNEFLPGRRGVLSKVPASEILNIDGHGSDTRAILGAHFRSHLSANPTRAEKDSYTVVMLYFTTDVLAKRLEKEGLSKSHKRIDMLICHAGEAGSGGAHRTFASMFALQLGKLGYSKIIVGGYPGEASTEGSGADATNMVNLSVLGNVEGRHKMRYFNAQGEEVLIG